MIFSKKTLILKQKEIGGINIHLNETEIKVNNETKSKKEKCIFLIKKKKKKKGLICVITDHRPTWIPKTHDVSHYWVH